MTRILPATLGALVIVTFLAGCIAEPDSVPTSSEPSSNSPAPTTPAATKPALGDLVISTEGLGPLKIGSPVPTEPDAVAIVKFDPNYCSYNFETSNEVVTPDTPFSGGWLTTYSDPLAFQIFPVGGIRSAAIGEISVWAGDTSSAIHTAVGIHPGSSTADLKAAYPKFDAMRSYSDLSDVYSIEGKNGVLIFETTPSVDTPGGYEWSLAELNRVVSIRVLSSDSTEGERLTPHSNSDGYGYCA